MGDAMTARLLDHVSARQDDFVPTSIGPGSRGREDPSVRRSLVLGDFGALREEIEARFRAVMDRTLVELGMPPIDLQRLEMELVVHGDGGFYRTHIDTMTDRTLPAGSDRVLTGVYYFHRRPKAFSGGALRLHAFTQVPSRALNIVPDCDTLLLFPSWAPHEVLPVSCPSGAFLDGRFAINCWYRDRRKG